MQQQKPHLMLNLSERKYKWEEYNIDHIVGGKNSDNVALLKIFLTDYTKIFSTKVNPSCNKCMITYHNNYKQKIYKMENPKNTEYKLKLKYQNIPLRNEGKGYNVMVNNDNLTDEFAEILLERYSKEKIFESYPIISIKNVEIKEKITVKKGTKKTSK
jgi:hypothetical protein